MNKTVAFIVVGSLVGLAIVGAVVLTIHRPDASATFIQQVVQLIGLVITAAGTLYGLGKLDKKMEVVKTNTNGTLSELRAKLEEVTAERNELALADARRKGGDHRLDVPAPEWDRPAPGTSIGG